MGIKWVALAVLAMGILAAATSGTTSGKGHPRIESASWLDGPVALDGKVVAVEFWTFACINCVRTVPAMKKIHETYAPRGLVVVGVHSPELDHERDPAKVREAVHELGIPYAVAIDNDYATWKSFDNHYWPTLYLLDRTGAIRYRHVGELHDATPEWREVTRTIESLLSE